MSTSTARGTYTDCYELFDRALTTERGVMMKFPDHGAAYKFRQRMNAARLLDRELVSKVEANNDKFHPKFNTSKYDPFAVRLDYIKQSWYVLVERRIIYDQEIEEIPPREFADEIEEETGLDMSQPEDFDVQSLDGTDRVDLD